VPTFEIIDGIKIECFSGEHPPPHIHASYSGFEVLIIIEDQQIYAGNVPVKKLKKAIEFVQEHKLDLMFLFNELNQNLRKKDANQ
jgi:hypothetical protein